MPKKQVFLTTFFLAALLILLQMSRVSAQVENEGNKDTKKFLDNVVQSDVRAVELKAEKIHRNEKGFWEADYGDGIKMVYIPKGEFEMGSNDGQNDEEPKHKVNLDAYWMGKTEVTVSQFRAFVEVEKYVTEAEISDGAYILTGRKLEKKAGINWKDPGFKQEDNHPVVCVSWNDAVAYCKWLSGKKGVNFRLPTEAQWERAAGGTGSRKYPWGNNEPDHTLANFGGKVGKTTRVGSYPGGASPYGLLDMAGSVWEWCYDNYGSYSPEPQKNPRGPGNGSNRVVRGSSWNFSAGSLRRANRGLDRPSFRSDYIGFRLCQDN